MQQNDLFNPDVQRFYEAISKEPDFDGKTYDVFRDKERLTKMQKQLFEVMQTGEWWTIPDLSIRVFGSETGISAAIRNFRKLKFGGYLVEVQHIKNGLFRYRLDVNGYDPKTYEQLQKVYILKWKCQKILQYFDKPTDHVNHYVRVYQQLLDVPARLSKGHIQVLSKSIDGVFASMRRIIENIINKKQENPDAERANETA